MTATTQSSRERSSEDLGASNFVAVEPGAIRDRFWALMDEPSPLIEAIDY